MMKLLWLCNMIPSAVSAAMGNPSGGGMWVDHVLNDLLLLPDLQLTVLCRSDKTAQGRLGETGAYRLFSEPIPERYYPALEGEFKAIVQEVMPDVVHIWGTEFGHTLGMMRALTELKLADRAVISIQGLCSYIPQHHNEGFPESVIHAASLRDFLKHDNLAQQAATFAKRGAWEQEALKLASHVIGRTCWDRACTNEMNPSLTYHFCNETMREPFYYDTWQYEACQKHRIFAPNWTDPSKGFHYLLRALAIVRRQFPDAEVYVTGRSYYPKDTKARLKMRAHHKYLIRLTEENGLRDAVHFMGHLSAEEMKQAFLDSNVFVLPSTIENSPNTVGESMLLGVPCVSADVGGVIHMMKHGEEGFVYQSSAEYLLAHYIMEVFRMGKDAEAMGLRARAHALKTHDPKTNLQNLLDAYQAVFSAK